MAGRIPQHFIDELLSRVDIVDVISQRVPLKKSGSNYSACCPFHNEKTPSFMVSPSKQFYHCFGCQANGSAISFIMEYEQLHFIDAVETLAEPLGLEVPRDDSAQSRENSRKPLYDAMERCAQYYYQQLKHSADAIHYLKQRKLSGETAKRFGIGFAPDGWDKLSPETGASSDVLVKLGMLVNKSDKSHYDRFRKRIMFPIRDRRGRVIAFGGRLIEKGEPKYLNSPETPLFHKGKELYGFFEARKAAAETNSLIVVEGYMDVVMLSQHGIHNCVATLGTATSSSHIETLFRTVADIYFCFDGDRAGKQAAWRALKALLPSLQDGRDAYFAFLPEGHDPDSFVGEHGKTAFEEFLNHATLTADFLIQHLSEDLDVQTMGGKAKLAELSKPLINQIPDGVYKQLIVEQIETLIGTSLGMNASSHAASTTEPKNADNAKPPKPTNAATNATRSQVLRRAVSLLLQKPQVMAHINTPMPSLESNSVGTELLKELMQICKENLQMSTAALLEHYRDTKHYKGLSKLATVELLPNAMELSDEAAEQEFADILIKLTHLATQRDAQLVDPSLQKGLLSLRNKSGLKKQ